MPRMIFVNLPVADLARSRTFYEALGFTHNPRFSDDSAACMVWSDTIFVMILTRPRWAGFTSRPIPPGDFSEVMLCLSVDSRAQIDRLCDAGGRAGAIVDVNPAQDHGFMASRALADPDGHVWELTWMDPAAAAGEG